jgi:predicted esterase
MAADSPHPPDFVHRFEAGSPELPTLLLLHGTGGDENDLLEVGRRLAPGAALLSPRGKVLENGLARFFRRLSEGVFDLEDLRYRAGELAEFVTAACRRYGLDAARVTAAGYSNGANIAAALLLLRPETLREAVLFHAMVPLVPEKLPELKGRRVFLSAGRVDRLIPPRESERLAALLEEAGAGVRLFWQPGGHALERAEIEAAREWLSEGS